MVGLKIPKHSTHRQGEQSEEDAQYDVSTSCNRGQEEREAVLVMGGEKGATVHPRYRKTHVFIYTPWYLVSLYGENKKSCPSDLQKVPV